MPWRCSGWPSAGRASTPGSPSGHPRPPRSTRPALHVSAVVPDALGTTRPRGDQLSTGSAVPVAGQDVVRVDDLVGVALLGQEALAVRCVLLVERVPGDHAVEPGRTA